jgi:hypothetical protein
VLAQLKEKAMVQKMQKGKTYDRLPSTGRFVVDAGGTNSNGKSLGRKTPTTVNNSTQGRGVPKPAKKER